MLETYITKSVLRRRSKNGTTPANVIAGNAKKLTEEELGNTRNLMDKINKPFQSTKLPSLSKHKKMITQRQQTDHTSSLSVFLTYILEVVG